MVIWLNIFSVAVLVAMAGPSSAQSLSAVEQAVVADGHAVVHVTPDDRGADGQIAGVIDVPAPRSAVWRVLVDCEHAPTIMANLKSCRVLQHSAGPAMWDVREHQIVWTSVLPAVRSVFRSEYVAEKSIRFVRTDASDLTHLEGEWRLEPIAGGAGTRLLYRARFGFMPLIPTFLVRQSLATDFPRFLETIRAAAIKLN